MTAVKPPIALNMAAIRINTIIDKYIFHPKDILINSAPAKRSTLNFNL